MDNIHFIRQSLLSDIQRNLGCELGMMCKASSRLELRFILEGTKNCMICACREALFLVLKDLIQVWVMFSRQSGDIPGDSTFDISTGLLVGGCVQQTGNTL